jgi:asparagine synthase (glutamine-hydrolysing)
MTRRALRAFTSHSLRIEQNGGSVSVQAGIRYFDNRPVHRPELEFLVQGLEQRAPDYLHFHLSESLGMAFRGLLIAREDRPYQPVAGLSGSAVTVDGRLDSRSEIGARLGFELGTTHTDAMLALFAYESFGRECFHFLKGEIACAVWDEQRGSLFLFRSICGTRPLFYVADQSRIVWSSELDDLVLKSGVNPLVNDAYAIGYAYYQPDLEQSPYQNVHTVPSGTYVEVKSTGEIRPPVSVWHPENISTLMLRSDSEYEEAWRNQVKNAVAKKLRTKDPVFCELSGGLDSTILVLLSDQILKNAGRNSNELTTVSITFEISTTCDESRFIHLAETARGRAGIHVPESTQQPTFGLHDMTFTGAPNAHDFLPGRYQTIARAMKVAGARVLLTGLGGDHLFWSDQDGSPELADLLMDWQFRALLSRGREWSRVARLPLWQVLLSHALSPVVSIHRFGHWLPAELDLFPWNTKMVREFLLKAARTRGLQVNRQIALPSRRVRENMIRSFRALLSAGYFDPSQEIYFSHPYSNQELIEFVLALPMNQLVRPGQDRSLMRRATKELLPEPIRTRKSKGSINEAACRVLAREQEQIGESHALEVCQRGYADPQALASAMRSISLGRMDHSYALLRLMSLERWLRSLRTVEACRSILRNAPSRTPCNTAVSSGASIRHSNEVNA